MQAEEVECEWLAISGYLTMLDGERIYVEPGDTVVCEELPDGSMRFLDVTKRTLHS